MRTGWMTLIAAALTACGGAAVPSTTPATKDAGSDASEAVIAPDAGELDAEHVSGGAGGETVAAGSGGMPAQPSGGVSGGGSGGVTPRGGAGAPAQPQGGSPAPQERVLWSQTWTVEVHEPTAYGAVSGTKMALILDAGQLCRFGFMAADSGSTQEYETDGKCITNYSSPMGGAVFYEPSGSSANARRSDLVGWKEAVQGKTVLKLRRTQTYETQVLGVGETAWNYADFTGTWEAVGY